MDRGLNRRVCKFYFAVSTVETLHVIILSRSRQQSIRRDGRQDHNAIDGPNTLVPHHFMHAIIG